MAMKEKVFTVQESLLTEIFKCNEHINSACNMLTALYVALFVSTFSYYAIDVHELAEDVQYLRWAFSHANVFFATWSCLVVSTIIPFVLVKRFCGNKSHIVRFLSKSGHFAYMTGLFIVPPFVSKYYNLTPPMAFAIVVEQIRLSMKMHSFGWESQRFHNSSNDAKFGKPLNLTHFLYYLFAPTLLYRPSYPRTKSRSIQKIIVLFAQVLATIFCVFICARRFVVTNFRSFGQETIDAKQMVSIISFGCLIGGQLMLVWWYGLLHCWLNAWAEMLKFGDRLFYSDWWSCSQYSTYYRKWNLVVHDWLHKYIYRYVIEEVGGSRNIATWSVFIISAVLHEYIIVVTFGFVYPVLFVFFAGAGMVMFFLTKNVDNSYHLNTFLFLSLFLGWDLLLVLYGAEWYSRINCPPYTKGILDAIIPRSWSCYSLVYQKEM